VASLVAAPPRCVANIGISPSFVGEENAETIVEAHVIAEV